MNFEVVVSIAYGFQKLPATLENQFRDTKECFCIQFEYFIFLWFEGMKCLLPFEIKNDTPEHKSPHS